MILISGGAVNLIAVLGLIPLERRAELLVFAGIAGE